MKFPGTVISPFQSLQGIRWSVSPATHLWGQVPCEGIILEESVLRCECSDYSSKFMGIDLHWRFFRTMKKWVGSKSPFSTHATIHQQNQFLFLELMWLFKSHNLILGLPCIPTPPASFYCFRNSLNSCSTNCKLNHTVDSQHWLWSHIRCFWFCLYWIIVFSLYWIVAIRCQLGISMLLLSPLFWVTCSLCTFAFILLEVFY